MPSVTSYPLVSVAMCTFNGAAYIREQLETIMQQSWTNLEIVISDDGSTDDTIAIIYELQQKDPRIKFFRNEKQLGYNKNFEKAFSLCQADFIAISDQDDIWERDKIEYMMKAWPEGASFIYSLSGSFINEDFEHRKAAPGVFYSNITALHKLVFNSPVHGHACMFKKELLAMTQPFPDDIFYDWWMSMHAASSSYIGCVPKTLTWHRVHGKNSSREIMSIKDAAKRNKELRLQSAYFIETFCSRSFLKEDQKASLLQYAALLKKLDGKTFSAEMFRYVYANRKLVFHYKKPKPFLWLSYIKHAYRMAHSGVL